MAHRTLALKYRPQVFADLIGQDHVSEVLTRAIERNRVAQAYLFTGARGVGKTTSARDRTTVTWSCPIRSPKVWGRYLRARARLAIGLRGFCRPPSPPA